MNRRIIATIVTVVIMTLCLSVNAESGQTSDYNMYYSQFVDSKKPLAELEKADKDLRAGIDSTRLTLKKAPDPNRVDYFDVAYGTDPLQKLDIHHLSGSTNRPVIFFIHGGGWKQGDKDYTKYFGPTWVSLGYTVVSINYRLAPKDPHPAQIEDCAMALKWVIDNISKYGGDPNRICITGNSAGGHLTALLVAGTKWHEKYNIDMKSVKCWIPDSGIYNFNLKENFYHPWMREFDEALLDDMNKKDDASPINYITGDEPPCLIVHGADDWLVPRTNATEFYSKLIEKGVEAKLELIKGYCHLNTIVTFGLPGDIPTKVINKYLAKYLPTDENNLNTISKIND